MGLVESLPVTRVRPVLFLPLWLGTMRDASGYANHATPTMGTWRQTAGRDGFDPIDTSGVITVPDSPELQLTEMTLFTSGQQAGNFAARPGAARWIVKRDAGGTNWDICIDTGGARFVFYDGVVFRTRAASGVGNKTIAITVSDGDIPNLYLDGSIDGAFSGTVAMSKNDADIKIARTYTASSPYPGKIECVMIYDTILTSAEIAALHTWSQGRFTPRKQWPGGGLKYPNRETNLIADGDCDDVSGWTVSNNAVLTNMSDGGVDFMRVSYGGSNNPGALQGGVLTVGQDITMEARCRGDGIWAPKLLDGAGGVQVTGTSSTDWQILTAQGNAKNAAFYARSVAAGAGYADFDYIKIWTRPAGYTPATGDPLYLDNIQSARVTLADETSGQLSNTGYTIQSGTWAVKEDATTGERYIDCITSGAINRRNTNAYGTWDLKIQKAGSNATIGIFGTEDAPAAAGNDGYGVYAQASAIWLARMTNGGIAAFVGGVSTPIDSGVDYNVRVTRTSTGEWTVYIMGGAYAQWTQVINGTDNTHTAAKTSPVFLITGDRIYLDRQFAGVVAPEGI